MAYIPLGYEIFAPSLDMFQGLPSLQSMGTWIELVYYCCVKIV